jgi:hypothetical protein
MINRDMVVAINKDLIRIGDNLSDSQIELIAQALFPKESIRNRNRRFAFILGAKCVRDKKIVIK